MTKHVPVTTSVEVSDLHPLGRLPWSRPSDAPLLTLLRLEPAEMVVSITMPRCDDDHLAAFQNGRVSLGLAISGLATLMMTWLFEDAGGRPLYCETAFHSQWERPQDLDILRRHSGGGFATIDVRFMLADRNGAVHATRLVELSEQCSFLLICIAEQQLREEIPNPEAQQVLDVQTYFRTYPDPKLGFADARFKFLDVTEGEHV